MANIVLSGRLDSHEVSSLVTTYGSSRVRETLDTLLQRYAVLGPDHKLDKQLVFFKPNCTLTLPIADDTSPDDNAEANPEDVAADNQEDSAEAQEGDAEQKRIARKQKRIDHVLLSLLIQAFGRQCLNDVCCNRHCKDGRDPTTSGPFQHCRVLYLKGREPTYPKGIADEAMGICGNCFAIGRITRVGCFGNDPLFFLGGWFTALQRPRTRVR